MRGPEQLLLLRRVLLEELRRRFVDVLVALLGTRVRVEIARGASTPHNRLGLGVDDVDDERTDEDLLDIRRTAAAEERAEAGAVAVDLDVLVEGRVIGDEQIRIRRRLDLVQPFADEL